MPKHLSGHVEHLGGDRWRLRVNLPSRLRVGADGEVRRVYPRKYREVEASGVRMADGLLRDFIAEQEARIFIDPEGLTVARLIELWLANKPRLRPRSRQFYAENAERHIVPALGLRRAASITPSDLDALYASLRESGLGDTSVRHVHATLRAAYNWARRDKLLAENPAAGIASPPTQARRRIAVWDEATIARALVESDGHQRKPYRPQLVHVAIALGALAGLRPAESCGLRWDDIEGELLHVQRAIEQVGGALHVEPPKSDAGERWVPIDPELARILQAHKARQDKLRMAHRGRWNREGYVLARVNGQPVKPDNLGGAFARFCRVHDLPPMTLHGLRHSFASNIFRHSGEGALKVVQGLLGHKLASTTADIYLHDDADQRRAALVAQGERMAAAMKAAEELRFRRDSVAELKTARAKKPCK